MELLLMKNPLYIHRVKKERNKLIVTFADRHIITIDHDTEEECEKACEALIKHGASHRIKIRIENYGDIEIDD